MATLTRNIEAFSVSHAAILDGETPVSASYDGSAFGDIFGVREASITVGSNSYDNTGDDTVQSTWFWFDYGELTVQSGYVPFDTIALLSGTTIKTTGTGDNAVHELPVWTTDSVNQPARPVLIRVPAKDSNQNVRIMDIILYKVQFNPFTFTGPTYKSGLLLNYSGRALTSPVDEAGNTLYKHSSSGTATGGTTTTLTMTGAGWTTDEFAGGSVTITGGLGSSQVARTVVSNTPTALTVDPAWATAPDNTSTFSVGACPYRALGRLVTRPGGGAVC